MYTMHMFEDIKKRISVSPAFYVSFMCLLLCVYAKRQHRTAKCYIQQYFIYILYAHCAESQLKCTFPKMCANISTDYNLLEEHISKYVTI